MSRTINKKAADEEGTTPEQLIDLINFTMAFDAFIDHLRGQGLEPDEFAKEGAVLIRRYLPVMKDGILEHLDALKERPDAAMLKAPLLRVERGGGPSAFVAAAAGFFNALMPWLRAHPQAFRGIFSGRAATVARQVVAVSEEDSPLVRLNKAAQVPSASRLMITRRWVQEAAAKAGSPLTDNQALAVAAVEARQVAMELREVSTQLGMESPGSADSVELSDRKAQLESQLAGIVEASPSPEAIKAVAATEQANTQQGFATEMGRKLGMTPEQEKALMATGKVVIAAGAGSGKTRVLAGKVVDTLTRLGAKSNEIIATSFSKKSATELKRRIVQYGGEHILDAGDQGIGTTHSVSLSLLKEFKPQVGNARIMDSDTYLVKMAIKQVQMRPDYDRKVQPPNPVGMFDGLFNKDQDIPAVAQPDGGGNSAPSAVPGVDPTQKATFQRVLRTIRGLSDWVLKNKDPRASWAISNIKLIDNILNRNIGPTEMGAAERAAVETMINRPGSVNSLARAGLGGYQLPPATTGKSAADAASIPQKVQSPYWKQPANQWFNLGVDKMKDPQGRPIGARRFGTAISKYRANLITPSQAWKAEESVFAAVYGAYDWLKQNDATIAGSIDFDDMLLECCKMLVSNPTARAMIQARFKHVLVDEAQDLNRAQHLLFGLISGYYDPETQKPKTEGKMTAETYCFIGDDKQAIYEFRGAIPDLFIEKSDLVEKGEGFKTHLLDTNFRSGKNIVDAANKLIANNNKQIPMTCRANVDRKGMGVIHNVVVETHEEAAAYAARMIDDATKGEGATAGYNDFGVAVRTNAEAFAFGVEMLKRGIPFRSKVNFFNDSTTKALIYWLKLAGADENDKKTINDVVLNAFEVPRFGLDKVFQIRLQEEARGQNYLDFLRKGGWADIYGGNQEWRNRKNVKPYADTLWEVFKMDGKPADVLQSILGLEGAEMFGKTMTIVESLVEEVRGSPEAMDLLAEEAEDGRISEEAIKGLALAPIQPLLSLIGSYEDIGPALGYVEQLQRANDKKGKKDNPDAEDYKEPAVVIDTCHGWKGLEVKHIFVPMAKGVFPHKASEADEVQMASERRLAYVALTRGENQVTILNPKVTHTGQEGGVSQFVEEACIRPLGGEDTPPELAEEGTKTAALDPAFLQAFVRGDFEPTEEWDPTPYVLAADEMEDKWEELEEEEDKIEAEVDDDMTNLWDNMGEE